MAKRGAKHIILLSRQKPSSYQPATKTFLESLWTNGIDVRVPACDVADAKALEDTLRDCVTTMPPIKGCIQSSMVLQEGLFANLRLSEFRNAIYPKVLGSWNLHKLLSSDLDFFIMFASGVGLLGNYGQSDYAAGNTYQDALARYRIANGQKAISLDLGIIQTVGHFAETLQMEAGNRAVDFIGSSQGVAEEQLHALMDYVCNPNLSLSDPDDVQIAVGLDTPANLHARGNIDPYWLRTPITSYLRQIDYRDSFFVPKTPAAVDYTVLLNRAQNIGDAIEIIYDAVAQKLSRFISVEKENLERTKPMHTYGVDSLSAIELRKWFARVLQAEMTVLEIAGNATIEAIAKTTAMRSRLVSEKLKT